MSGFLTTQDKTLGTKGVALTLHAMDSYGPTGLSYLFILDC